MIIFDDDDDDDDDVNDAAAAAVDDDDDDENLTNTSDHTVVSMLLQNDHIYGKANQVDLISCHDQYKRCEVLRN